MSSLLRHILKFLAVPAFAAVLGSCGNLGTAVVLWPPEDGRWQPGDLLTVKDESLLRSTYIVNLPGQRRLKEEVDRWRMRLFRREREAVAFAQALSEWKDVYAECLYQGLPMRSEPSNTASRIYRFRDGDTMKILGREPGPVPVGNLEGYWYHILADGGVEGYVFDYHLKVIRVIDGQTEILNVRKTSDPALDNFLTSTWRPNEFGNMVARSRINLNRFRTDYGLFPNTERKTISIKMPGYAVTETWTEIVPAGRNRYDFLGTGIRVTINHGSFISVQYNVDGDEKFEGFVRLERDMASIIENEVERRGSILERFISNGPAYGSRAYGNLTFTDDGRFSWSGKSSLISRGLLSQSAGNRGRIGYDVFPNPAISASHDGVLSMRFESGEQLVFLYAFENEGLRMLYVPEKSIEDGLVKSDQYIDPVQLFFAPRRSAGESEGTALPERN